MTAGIIAGCFLQYRNETTNKECTRQLFAMDTVMTLEAYGENAAEAVELAADEIYRIEDELSAEDENSDLFSLNRDKEAEVGEDAFYLIDYSRKISEATDGCFDITVYPAVKLWGFIDDNYRVPTDDEIKKAAILANADSFIKRLPDGYNTCISNDEMLSAGEVQLINIARVMLLNPPILILDEATSNIDLITENKIQKAFETLISNSTSFIIAHRLWSIKNADRILYIENGNIIEQGTHQELINKKGKYFELYNSQFVNNI